MKIAVLGAGSVRCTPSIIGSLAGYFGERPLEVTFWDTDFERLDLFDRFARLCFRMTKSSHELIYTEDPEEALAGARGVLLAVGHNCAKRFLSDRGSLVGHGETGSVLIKRCVYELLDASELDTRVLSLIDVEPDGHLWTSASWPQEPTEQVRKAVPHQILRYLIGDEYPHDFLKQSVPSPVTEWLDKMVD